MSKQTDSPAQDASDYEHGKLYIYDATSQTFDPISDELCPVPSATIAATQTACEVEGESAVNKPRDATARRMSADNGSLALGRSTQREDGASPGSSECLTPAATDDIDWDTLAEERLEQRPRRSPAEGEKKFEGERVTILQDDFESLCADRRELSRLRDTIDLLERNARIQAKLLADTGRERDQARALVEAAATCEPIAEEGIEILVNLSENIRKGGHYSVESTIGFLDQAASCFREISRKLSSTMREADHG